MVNARARALPESVQCLSVCGKKGRRKRIASGAINVDTLPWLVEELAREEKTPARCTGVWSLPQCGRHRGARRPVGVERNREIGAEATKWKQELECDEGKSTNRQGKGDRFQWNHGENKSSNEVTVLAVEPPSMLMIRIVGYDVLFELDTGASMSIIGKKTWRRIGASEVRESGVEATAYNNERIRLQGQVAEQASHPLCGRDMIKALQIECGPHYNQAQLKNEIVRLLHENKELFEDGARTVPIAPPPKVEAKLQLSNGSLRAVEHSQWATPLVVVPKP
ncbi:hypothetical protein OSTOST_14601, partial [Ostertagia ostertagi]